MKSLILGTANFGGPYGVSSQNKIANESIEISKLEAEAADQEQKANQKSLTYKAACEARKAMIASDLQKINNLIK